MKPNDMTRKEFVRLTFTLIGVSAAAGACSSTNTSNDGGTGAAGSTAGASGSGGTGGTGGGGGTGGTGGTGGASACHDPLPDHQDADTLGHVHTLVVPASTLSLTGDQTFNTGVAGTPPHMHMVTLTAANLATIKGGGTVDVPTSLAEGHLHMFTVGCTAV